MTRTQLLAHLADLVAHGHLSPTEARTVIEQYDAGELPDLPLVSTSTEESDNRAWLAALALLLLVRGNGGSLQSSSQQQRAQRLLRQQYNNQANQLALSVGRARIPVPSWQSGMMAAVQSYSLQMAIAGAGALPSRAVQQVVNGRVAAQQPYLTRFATQIYARKVVGREMGTLAIAARAEKYGGTGWGSFFVGQGDDAHFGYVERWDTQDKGQVCRVCSPRDGQTYLPGEGPMPGWDCLGTCRCRRTRLYNPKEYARLRALPVEDASRKTQGGEPAPAENRLRRLSPVAGIDRLAQPPTATRTPGVAQPAAARVGTLKLEQGRAVREQLLAKASEFEQQQAVVQTRQAAITEEQQRLLAVPREARTDAFRQQLRDVLGQSEAVHSQQHFGLAEQRAVLALPPGERSTLRWSIRGELDAEQRAVVDESLAFVNSVARDKAGLVPLTIDPTYARAFEAEGRIYASGNQRAKSYVHEMGHNLETSASSRKWAQRQAFFDQRTVGDVEEKLADVFPGRGLGEDEVFKRDRWLNAYAGKIYADGPSGSEIISMGLQHLYEAPLKFAQADPDFFDFIISYLREP